MITQKNADRQVVSQHRSSYPKLLLFTVMGLMTLFVMYLELSFFGSDSPGKTRLLSMKGLLIPHVLFAATGFVLGPLQFSSRLRTRNLMLHRLPGKVYVISILLGAALALAITCVYRVPDGNFMFENIIQAVVWFLTTLVAWLAARNKQIALHKVWMARSYGITFIYVLSRVVTPIPFFQRLDIASASHFLWFLLILALLLPELFLNGKALLVRSPSQ